MRSKRSMNPCLAGAVREAGSGVLAHELYEALLLCWLRWDGVSRLGAPFPRFRALATAGQYHPNSRQMTRNSSRRSSGDIVRYMLGASIPKISPTTSEARRTRWCPFLKVEAPRP